VATDELERSSVTFTGRPVRAVAIAITLQRPWVRQEGAARAEGQIIYGICIQHMTDIEVSGELTG
jgi:hypothetical protein